jgi:hypothetical protein
MHLQNVILSLAAKIHYILQMQGEITVHLENEIQLFV